MQKKPEASGKLKFTGKTLFDPSLRVAYLELDPRSHAGSYVKIESRKNLTRLRGLRPIGGVILTGRSVMIGHANHYWGIDHMACADGKTKIFKNTIIGHGTFRYLRS